MPLAATVLLEEDLSERRVTPRRVVGQETTLRRSGIPTDAYLHDLSATGAAIETSASLAEGAVVTIGLPGVGRVAATVVSTDGSRHGCRFETPLPPSALAAAFGRDPIVFGSFGGEAVAPASTVFEPPVVEKYPGFVRVALPIGGALLGWASIIYVARLVVS